MSALLQTGLGIGVSVLLFLIGYRQTVGAKKERIQAANTALRKSVMRRLVLEEYQPSARDLGRVIEGKAREYRVASDDLLSEEQLLTDVFAAVFDSDLIDASKRKGIEDRISGGLQALQSPAARLERLGVETPGADRFIRLMGPLVLATTLAGTLVSLAPQIIEGSLFTSQTLQLAATVAVASIGFMVALLLARRQRDVVSRPQDSAARAARFEAEVAALLGRAGLKVQLSPSSHSGGADFLVSHEGQRIAVEARAWRGTVPRVVIGSVVSRLSRILADGAADKMLIVVPDDVRVPPGVLEDSRIEIVRAGSLLQWLKRRPEGGAKSA